MRVPDGERGRLVLDHVAVDLDARRHGFTYCGYLTVIVEGADRVDPPFRMRWKAEGRNGADANAELQRLKRDDVGMCSSYRQWF